MIVIVLVVVAIIAQLMIYLGWIPNDFYKHPTLYWLSIAYLVSLFIGISTLIMINGVFIKPLHNMIEAMNELAKGNFNVRIRLEEGSHSVEVNEFAKSYNKAAEELGSVEILRKDFINNFSHEFKTPIVSIEGFAQLLKEGNLSTEEIDEYLTIIINESDRLANLSTNVLGLSKIESETNIGKKELFNVSEQIRQTIVMMEAKWSAKELSFDLDLENIEYYGNPQLLKHVWVNILDNAIKFSPTGATLFVEIQNHPNSFTFKVRDQGVGMNEDTIDHIFDRFYQGDTSHSSEGNGLGMTMVKKVLLLHDGQINIDSTPNMGTTMTITLPKSNLKE